MDVGRFSLAKASGSFVLAAIHVAGLADTGALRCDPAPRWEDASSIEMAVQSDRGGSPAFAMTLEMAVHDNGLRLISVQDGRRIELIQLRRLAGVALSSDPAGPKQLFEADMVFSVPFGVAKRQFPGPCEMRANTRYPVDFSVGDDTVTGEVEREGNTMRIAVLDTRKRGNISYTGRLVFKSPHGSLPMDLSLRGWTIFHDGLGPEASEASRFDTLGDFLNSLPAAE